MHEVPADHTLIVTVRACVMRHSMNVFKYESTVGVYFASSSIYCLSVFAALVCGRVHEVEQVVTSVLVLPLAVVIVVPKL